MPAMPEKAVCKVRPLVVFQLVDPKLVTTLASAAESVSGLSVPGVDVG